MISQGQQEENYSKMCEIHTAAEIVINHAMKSAESTVNSSIKDVSKSTILYRTPISRSMSLAFILPSPPPPSIELEREAHKASHRMASVSLSSSSSCMKWHWEIKDFSLDRLVAQISDFVNRWKLSKGIKFCIKHIKSYFDESAFLTTPSQLNLMNTTQKYTMSRHYIDVLFSKPTMVCPNPLAVAKVHFIIYAVALKEDELQHQDHHHQKEYSPCTLVSVKYQFEGFKSWHTVDSDRFDFQDAYIRFIIDSKTKFFSLNGVLN
ncbi:uncharacterized protein LOC129941203 [Eupeodes corollae]|uniref:uncharacterized protein LOC129941203 n=1 Tax=Eupeodes corollae TaxID=290404 RepID=UPI0024939BE9|nr:uncharacterized protein LOC129941203 [Eupeodes corollae]